MTKLKKHRKWLKKNLIFFQAFSLSFLGIAGIIVAVNNTIISNSQLDLLKLEHLPIVNIQRNFLNSRETIKIRNIGYHMFEPKIECTSIVVIEDYSSIKASCEMDYYFEVVDFFEDELKIENTIGDLFILNSDYSTNLEINNWMEKFKEVYGENVKGIELQHFICIGYKDEVKKEHYRYYTVTSNSIIEISKRSYTFLRQQQKIQSTFQRPFLTDLKPEKTVADIQNIYNQFLRMNMGLTECDI